MRIHFFTAPYFLIALFCIVCEIVAQRSVFIVSPPQRGGKGTRVTPANMSCTSELDL